MMAKLTVDVQKNLGLDFVEKLHILKRAAGPTLFLILLCISRFSDHPDPCLQEVPLKPQLTWCELCYSGSTCKFDLQSPWCSSARRPTAPETNLPSGVLPLKREPCLFALLQVRHQNECGHEPHTREQTLRFREARAPKHKPAHR